MGTTLPAFGAGFHCPMLAALLRWLVLAVRTAVKGRRRRSRQSRGRACVAPGLSSFHCDFAAEAWRLTPP